jgi:ribosomal protein S18 acetylase RimI-like enzyme
MSIVKIISTYLILFSIPIFLASTTQNIESWHDIDTRGQSIIQENLEWTKIDLVNSFNDNVEIKLLIPPQWNQLIQEVGQLYAVAFKESNDQFLNDVKLGPQISGTYIVVKIKDKNGKCVGFANFLCTNINAQEAFLESLALLPEARGLGLAKALIFSIFKINPTISTICLHVDKNNQHARDVYEHCGFKLIDEVRFNDSEKVFLRYRWSK